MEGKYEYEQRLIGAGKNFLITREICYSYYIIFVIVVIVGNKRNTFML